MAANQYKIGDRVVVVQKWQRRPFERMNYILGSIVTIESVCERVLPHHKREKFYQFAEARNEGHVWDDSDIAGYAPMLPKPRFDIEEGQEVVFLAHDGTYDLRPGIVTRVANGHFTVQDKWNFREFIFQRDNFRCVDRNECSRVVVYRDENMAKEDQKLVRLQRQFQHIFWQYAHRVPSVEDLERVVNCIIPQS